MRPIRRPALARRCGGLDRSSAAPIGRPCGSKARGAAANAQLHVAVPTSVPLNGRLAVQPSMAPSDGSPTECCCALPVPRPASQLQRDIGLCGGGGPGQPQRLDHPSVSARQSQVRCSITGWGAAWVSAPPISGTPSATSRAASARQERVAVRHVDRFVDQEGKSGRQSHSCDHAAMSCYAQMGSILSFCHCRAFAMVTNLREISIGLDCPHAGKPLCPELEEFPMTETLRSEIEIAAPQATVFAFLTIRTRFCAGWVRRRGRAYSRRHLPAQHERHAYRPRPVHGGHTGASPGL